MSVPIAMLALLSEGPAHGFALKKRYDDLLGHERELKPGQVYSTLARLERDGLAEGVGVEQAGAAERNIYAVTEAGLREMDSWLSTATLPSGRPSELFTRVVLAIVSGRSPSTIIDSHRATYLARMRQITAARHDADVVTRLAGDYEIAHLEADLNWVELATTRLDALTQEVHSA